MIAVPMGSERLPQEHLQRGPSHAVSAVFAWLLCSTSGASPPPSIPVIELGRALFNDTSLSADQETSCATCHDPQHAFTDARARSVGSAGNVGTRNAPSLIGIAKASAFFWDGR